VAAKAIGQHHQQGVAREAVAHAVLVDTAAALAAFLIDGESHVGLAECVMFVPVWHQLPPWPASVAGRNLLFAAAQQVVNGWWRSGAR
jgi:hypothetical protein